MPVYSESSNMAMPVNHKHTDLLTRIVRKLAKTNPVILQQDGRYKCLTCRGRALTENRINHQDCPWVLAQRYVESATRVENDCP